MTDSLSLFNQFTAPAPLLEDWGDVVQPDWGFDQGAGYATGPARSQHLQRPMTTRWDRLDGRYLPVYQTESELAYIRAEARAVAVVCPAAVNVIATKANYVLSTGFRFTANRDDTAPIDEEQAAPLLAFVQQKINRLLDVNKLICNMDREIQRATIEDGETFLHPKLMPTGDVSIHRLEPDQIVLPQRTRDLEAWLGCDEEFVSSWSFGVHTRELEPQNPLGYHVLYDAGGANWDYIRSSQMIHIKANAPSTAKRGVSDFFPVCQWFRKDAKVLTNIADGTAIQAAIAFIRQHAQGTTAVGASTMVGGNSVATRTVNKQNGGQQTRNASYYPPGTILDIAAGLEYMAGPMGSERNANFLLVSGAIKREIGTRWAMPEYMISGDSSNANFASTLVSGAPFVKACEAEQRFYGQYFLELIWKSLRLMYDAGQFARFGISWELLQAIVEITIGYPTVETKDPKARADAAAVEVQGGWLSPKTACEESGRDWDVEVANGLAQSGATAGAPAQAPQVNADGTPAATPTGELLGQNLQQVRRIDKLRDGYLAAFKAGTADEKTTRLALDGLGIPAAKIDLYLDADPANDPEPEPITEAIEGDVVPGTPPKQTRKLPSREELAAQTSARMAELIEALGDAVINDNKPAQKKLTREITDLQRAAGLAAAVLGIVGVFDPGIHGLPPHGKPGEAAQIEVTDADS